MSNWRIGSVIKLILGLSTLQGAHIFDIPFEGNEDVFRSQWTSLPNNGTTHRMGSKYYYYFWFFKLHHDMY